MLSNKITIYDKLCPLTDIVVLVYNNRNILPLFFEQLYLNTKIDEFNLIVVDNGSEDNSVSFIKNMEKKYSNILLIQNKQNRGVAGGRNDGAKIGKADYIVNLDSDQLVGPGWLNEQHAIMKIINCDFVGTEGWVMNGPKHPKPYFPCKKITSKYHSVTYIGGGNCLMKKSVFEDIGMYDEQFLPLYFEDPDASFSALKKGYKLIWNWKTQIKHLGSHTKTNFERKKQFTISYNKFKNKWMPWFPPPIKMIEIDKLIPDMFKKDVIRYKKE